MRVSDVLAMALQAIAANRLRSVLTLVGIVAGVASIIAVHVWGGQRRSAYDDEV